MAAEHGGCPLHGGTRYPPGCRETGLDLTLTVPRCDSILVVVVVYVPRRGGTSDDDGCSEPPTASPLQWQVDVENDSDTA